MSKPVSIGQSHAVMSVLANGVDWSTLDRSTLQRIIENPKEAGTLFDAFLRKAAECIAQSLRTLSIDRSTPFDPRTVKGLGEGWDIWEEDKRSLVLTEVDTSLLELTNFRDRETNVITEAELAHLISDGRIRLDAKALLHFLKNKTSIPEDWKKRDAYGNIRSIFFFGTILRKSNYRYVLYLYWEHGTWKWSFYSLSRPFRSSDFAVVLSRPQV